MTPFALLATYPDRSRPLVTQYSARGWRVELSVASFANAVAKAANMLRDGLGVTPGAPVSVDLPLHWQLPVWTMAGLSVGARCGRGLAGAEVRIVGPDQLPGAGQRILPSADEVLASSCDAFGLPVPGGVPAGVADIGIEVRAHGDAFTLDGSAASSAALLVAGRWVPWDGMDRGAGPGRSGSGAGGPARVWVDDAVADDMLLWEAAVRPLLSGASVVIGAGLDAASAQQARAAEAVTEVAGLR